MQRGKLSALVLAALSPAALALDVSPQDFSTAKTQAPYEIVIPHTAKPPVIDGSLADPAWDKAAVVKSFWRAGSLDMAQDQTIAWLCFDKDNLYVAWACQDAKIVASPLAHDDKQVWGHDSVELFLSPERDAGAERQFILSAAGVRFDRHSAKEFGKGGADWNPTPDWEGKVQPQPWGYTAEMRIPLAALLDTAKYPLGRGCAWTAKLTRQDKGDGQGMATSSWTPIGQTTQDPHNLGMVFFEDRNIIENGCAAALDDKGAPVGWPLYTNKCQAAMTRTAGKTEGSTAARVEIAGVDGSHFSFQPGQLHIRRQPVNTTYVFTADVKTEPEKGNNFVAYFRVGAGDNLQLGKFPHDGQWHTVRVPITILADQPFGMLDLIGVSRGKAAVTVTNASLEITQAGDMAAAPAKDEFCLTGNATGLFRGHNRRVVGAYTYTEAMTTDPCFPYYFPKGHGPSQDFGLYRGDVPFDKGLLTDGHTATTVGWPSFWTSYHGRDITFDLKKEYEVTRVVIKVSWPGLRLAHVYLKSPDDPVYTLVASQPDLVAFKSPARGSSEDMPRVDERAFLSINQTARWVRVQSECRSPGNYAEIEIWGREIAKPGAKPKRAAYLQAKGATPVAKPQSQPEPVRNVPPVFPLPQEMEIEGPAVTLTDGLAIQFEPVNSARAKTTAEVLRDELKLCFGLNATVAPAAPGAAPLILIGEAADSPATAAALKKAGVVKPVPSNPDGYLLAVRQGAIVIQGASSRGAFYGVQSLLTLTRPAATSGWEIPGVTLRDWPAMKYRFIEGRPVPSPNLIRALARFRVTHYIPKYINIAQAAKHDKFAERYFVEFIPFLDPNSIVLARDRSLVERAPDEDWKTMPTGRQNANPAHPKTWEIYFGELDKWLPQFHGGFVHIGMDETYQNSHGARWNVSPESRAQNLSAGPLLAQFLNKIHDKAKQHGKRLFMHDTPFFRDHRLSYPGDPDPSWLKALPLIQRDIVFNVWHWKKETTLDPLGKTYGHELIHLIADDRDWRKPTTEGEHAPWEYPGAFAGLNSYMAESSFTPNKLLDSMWVAWNPAAIRPHDPEADAAVARYVPLWNFLADGVPMPRSLLAQPADFAPLDISAAANRARVDDAAYDGKGWVDMGPNVDLRALPAGRIEMAGVPFQIIDESRNNGASVVMVHNRLYTDKTLPSTAEIDAKGVKAASLLFLHCLDHAPGWQYLRHKELAGYYYVVFEDGSCSRIQITYATNIGNWDGPTRWEYNPRGHTMAEARLAWTGQTLSGLNAFLYMTEWVNPRPDLRIQKIVLRSTFDPVFMNPMLLAVTATSPRLGIPPVKDKLPLAADLLAAPKPVGVPLDLANGKDESELRYVAPDGTVIEAAKLHNGLSDAIAYGFAQDWRSYVGMVTVDGHQSARAEELVFTFPNPVPLTGAMVTSRYREQRKAQNFPPMVYDLFVDVFVNGAWQQKAVASATCPEETGPAWLPLSGEPVQKLRLRQKRCEGTPDYAGYSFIQLFRKE